MSNRKLLPVQTLFVRSFSFFYFQNDIELLIFVSFAFFSSKAKSVYCLVIPFCFAQRAKILLEDFFFFENSIALFFGLVVRSFVLYCNLSHFFVKDIEL